MQAEISSQRLVVIAILKGFVSGHASRCAKHKQLTGFSRCDPA